MAIEHRSRHGRLKNVQIGRSAGSLAYISRRNEILDLSK
jgi:hypothetical protein